MAEEEQGVVETLAEWIGCASLAVQHPTVDAAYKTSPITYWVAADDDSDEPGGLGQSRVLVLATTDEQLVAHIEGLVASWAEMNGKTVGVAADEEDDPRY